MGCPPLLPSLAALLSGARAQGPQGAKPSAEGSNGSSQQAAQQATGAGQPGSGAAAPAGDAGPPAPGFNAAPAPGPAPGPGLSSRELSDLLNFAKTSAKFTEVMRRSSKSFEAFLERPDVRSNQQAKLVVMHLAAVCMDMGTAPDGRVVAHAREAVRTLCEDLAR